VTAPARFRLPLIIGAALLTVAPMLALSASPLSASGSLWYLGMLPALMGLFTSRRLAFTASLITPLLIGLALTLRTEPLLGALLMTAIGVGTGLSAARGWHLVGAFAGPLAAYALIGDLHVALPSATVAANASVAAGLATMAYVAGGGLWTALVGAFVVNAMKVKAPVAIPRHTAGTFAAALGVLVGVTAYVSMRWLEPSSWWIILTFFVVVQPYYADATHRMLERIAGTLAGALVAVIVVAALHDWPAVISILAFLLTFGAAYANLKLPYWVFATLLTPAVVLQTTGTTHDLLLAIGKRALYTLVGAAAALLVLTLGHLVIVARRRRVAAGAPGDAPRTTSDAPGK